MAQHETSPGWSRALRPAAVGVMLIGIACLLWSGVCWAQESMHPTDHGPGVNSFSDGSEGFVARVVAGGAALAVTASAAVLLLLPPPRRRPKR
jgi:hypothetical protein